MKFKGQVKLGDVSHILMVHRGNRREQQQIKVKVKVKVKKTIRK